MFNIFRNRNKNQNRCEIARIEISKLSLSSGDVLIIGLSAGMSKAQIESMKKTISEALPDGVKLLIINRDIMELHVVEMR